MPTDAPRPGWLLDELGSAGRENLDPAHVARYDGKEDAGAAAELALLEELGLDGGSTLAERGLGNVEVLRAGFLSYEHAGPPADFVYSRYALHHLPDFWKAVALARL